MVDFLTSQVDELILLIETIKIHFLSEIVEVSEKCVETIKSGGKIIFCGNGGSAAQAQHFAAELVNRFRLDRDPLPAIALTTDTSTITSVGNDLSFDEIFKRQILAMGKPGDILIGISTSGNSRNVIEAVKSANAMKMFTIGFCGENGELKEIVKKSINVPSADTPRIQEIHLLLGHLLCDLIEQKIFE